MAAGGKHTWLEGTEELEGFLGWYLAVEVVVCTVDDTAAISK